MQKYTKNGLKSKSYNGNHKIQGREHRQNADVSYSSIFLDQFLKGEEIKAKINKWGKKKWYSEDRKEILLTWVTPNASIMAE